MEALSNGRDNPDKHFFEQGTQFREVEGRKQEIGMGQRFWSNNKTLNSKTNIRVLEPEGPRE